MEIAFSINDEDLWHFNKFLILHMPRFILSRLGLFAVLYLALNLAATAIDANTVEAVFWATVIWLLLVIVSIRSQKALVKRAYSGTPGILGEHTITIDQKGFREVTVVNDSFFAWDGVTRIAENGKYIYLFTGNYQAYIIPKRAFGDPIKAQKFYAAATLYWNDARLANGPQRRTPSY